MFLLLKPEGEINTELPEESNHQPKPSMSSDTSSITVCDQTQYSSMYIGKGSCEDPFVVKWDVDDVEDPQNWNILKKWIMTLQVALGAFIVTFGSSCYSACTTYIMHDLHVSMQVALLGLSLYVLGFGIGPLLFSPLSEMYGRRNVFLFTFGPFAFLHLGGSLSRSITPIIVTRFLAGTMGSSLLTNGGGVVADIWAPRDRALPSAVYITGPFLGPVVGPMVGGYISESKLTWRFTFWLLFIVSSILLILGFLTMPESYAPALLRWRAQRLQTSEKNRIHFVSVFDTGPQLMFLEKMAVNLRRPTVMLFTEPIVTAMAIYMALAYATLYALFSAFPIVFQMHKHLSMGTSGLAFLGIGVGNVMGVALNPVTQALYRRSVASSPTGIAPPEARLLMGMAGAVIYPVGLWWFAWTSLPCVPTIAPIVAGIPFGIGMLLMFNSIMSYLMDTYPQYYASAFGAAVVLRSILGALFPIFTPSMLHAVGDQWGVSIFAVLAVLSAPAPFWFYRYGAWIRSKSKYAVRASTLEARSDGHQIKSSALEKSAA